MIRRRHEFALIMLFVAVVVAVVAVISTGLVGLGQEQQKESVLKGMNFVETVEVYSNGGVLRTTITAAKHEGKVGNQSVAAMVYNGSLGGPTLHAYPGDRIELKLVNALDEPTNLHFHGLHVSPSGRSDNVFREVGPGETALYVIDIPTDHSPGTFWYHSHQHHLSYKQVSGGMSGLIVIEGLEDLLPKSLHDIEECTLVMRDFPVISDPTVPVHRTINGQVNPALSIAQGETQLWRLANIGSETFYYVELPGHTFYVIAKDGSPVWEVWNAKQLLLPSGKRFDVLVTSAAEKGTYPLTALPYYPYPRTTLATLNVQDNSTSAQAAMMPTNLVPQRDLKGLEINGLRELIFSSNEEEGRYMINGKVYDPNRIDQLVKLGDLEEWKLRNSDEDEHPFHIHVNDFQVISVNGQRYDAHGLQDTVVIPGHGEVVVRIPFEDFVGKSVYHCHIMFHGDGGMMGVVEVIASGDSLEPKVRTESPVQNPISTLT